MEKEKNNMKVNIQDDFLSEENFNALRDLISSPFFPWFFQSELDYGEDGREETRKKREAEIANNPPGLFVHTLYTHNIPNSEFYESFFPILQALNIASLLRIRVNLNPRLPESYSGMFHKDNIEFAEDLREKYTVSIFYINTCNGFTELETGEKIESVANRMVSFSLNTKHRTITQTDEQARLLINFNYLKRGDE